MSTLLDRRAGFSNLSGFGAHVVNGGSSVLRISRTLNNNDLEPQATECFARGRGPFPKIINFADLESIASLIQRHCRVLAG
jgi:hypothetical protein